MNKDIVISLRIDSEIQEYIAFLKQRKVKHSDIIRKSIKESLSKKCKELKYREKQFIYPF